MRKLSNLRIEVITGILAAAALVGILLVGGVPSSGVAQGATAFKDGFHALSAAVVKPDKPKDNLPFGEGWLARELDRRASWSNDARKADSRFGNCKGRMATPAVAVKAEDRPSHCPLKAQAALNSSGAAPGCNDGKKSGDKKPSNGVCPMTGASAANECDGICPQNRQPARVPAVTTDKSQPKLAMAE